MSKRTFKFEGECSKCTMEATGEILDANMDEVVAVCDDCFGIVIGEVADEGKGYLYDWAVAMYGDEGKAERIVAIVFGEEEDGYKKEDAEGTMMMFTYGILKYPSNLKREGALQIIENSTISGHHIFLYANSYPVTKKTGNEADLVYGTLFEIPKSQVLRNYDYIEGYVPGRSADRNMYNREAVEVTTPTGEKVMAEMYYANQSMFGREMNIRTHIPTGNFDDKHLAKTYRPYGAGKKQRNWKEKAE